MEAKRRIGIVGLGSIGRRHARLLRERDDVAIELCEPNPKSLAAARGEVGDVPAHASFEALLAARPEMVVVATPHGLHADQTVAALNAGIHVLCEKPISDTLDGARRMREAADRTGRVLNIGFHLHFQPGVRRLKEFITGGALGRVLHIHCRVGSLITLVNSGSRYQAALEGALLLDYAHQPDLLHWLTGRRPRGVYMAALQGGDMDLTSNPNVLSITCDYAEPLLTTVHLNYVQMPERHEYEIVGDQAWALYDMKTGLLRIGRRAGETVADEAVSTERDPVYRVEHQAFLDAVDGKRAPESPAADATVSLEIIDAALRSWREQRRVELDGSCRRVPSVAG